MGRWRALKRDGDYGVVLLDEKIHAVETLYACESLYVRMTSDEEYKQGWATALVSHALERIETEFRDGYKTRLFGALKSFLTCGVGVSSQEEVAKQLNILQRWCSSSSARKPTPQRKK